MRTGYAIGAKAVVSVKNADPGDAHGVQVGDGFFGLALVGGAHVEDMFFDGLMQHHGACGRAHQGHTVLFKMGKNRFGVGCSACQKERDHVFFLDQLAGVFGGQLGVKLVVQRDQLDFLSIDAALGIDGVDIQLGAVGGLLDAGTHRAGESCGLSDQNLRLAGVAQSRQGQGRQPHIQFLHVVLLGSPSLRGDPGVRLWKLRAGKPEECVQL